MNTVRLTTQTGEDTSILFAFIRTLLTLLELEPPPTHFAVVFDAAGKTFRQASHVHPATPSVLRIAPLSRSQVGLKITPSPALTDRIATVYINLKVLSSVDLVVDYGN